MNEKMKRLLTPEGVRDLLPDTAARKRELESRIQAVFRRWGYREASTPAFEYSANFVGDMKAELADKMYRFLDERGRTLVLRPDFTLPLARVAATHMANEPKPLRLCYGGSIYRYASGLQGKQREVTQAGVEMIGACCAGADAEVIALAADALQELGLAEFTLCLGHLGFLDNLLAVHGITGENAEKIKLLFNKKDFVSLKELVAVLPVSEQARECILRVPALRGGKEALREAKELLPAGEAKEPLEVLEEVWNVLEDYGVTRFISLDLGLVRMLDYYTGMVFEGYTGGVGYPICGGGRYDQLLGHFGPDMAAVGFALNIDHLLLVLERQKKLPVLQAPLFLAYAEGGRSRAVAAAQELRGGNSGAVVDVKPRTEDEARREAELLGASRLLYYGETVLAVNLEGNGGAAGC